MPAAGVKAPAFPDSRQDRSTAVTQQKRVWIGALITLVIVAGTSVSWFKPASESHGTSPLGQPWWSMPMAHHPAKPNQAEQPQARVAAPPPPAASSPLDTVRPPVFRANGQGHLIIDPQTRGDVERVHALYAHDDGLKRLEAFSAELPDTAKRELKDLYQQWAQYAQAVMQAFPVESSSDSLEEARHQLAGLKQMRQQHFGPERTRLMFGEEEEVSEELLNRIEANKEPKLSLDDKVKQAQDELTQDQGTARSIRP